jgi:hypothetical protein
MGETIQLERIGTDGDMKKAIRLLESLDGKVAAFGLGGISFYLYAGGRRYVLQDALRLVKGIRYTPIADGSGIKNTLESHIISVFETTTGLHLAGKSAVMVSAVERYALAKSLVNAGCQTIFGDFMFGLGVPIPLHSLKTLDKIGRVLLPIVTHLPFQLLYPTGGNQDKQVKGKPRDLLAQSQVLAGDFHYIRRYLPDNLEGKIIITNTVTAQDHDMLVNRGAAWLATPSPNFSGRSFATNVLEALILAVSGKKAEELSPTDYKNYIERLKIVPRIEDLQGTAAHTQEG